jgi:hypothetical protein
MGNKFTMGDLSNRWQGMSQMEIYLATGEPIPKVAVKNGNSEKFHPDCAAYAWNNEPARFLAKIMDFREKKGLCVQASGDQTYIFVNAGAAAVLGYDITQIACFHNELKREAILSLTREEFLYFMLCKDTSDSGRKEKAKRTARREKLYDVLKANLTSYARQFFDEVITNHDTIDGLLRDDRYFRGDCFEYRAEDVPYTASDTKYSKLQGRLVITPYKLMWLGLTDALKVTPEETFDFIFVSNILDRWDMLFGGDFVTVLDLMKARLAKTPEARVIGNYQLGGDVARDIQKAADQVGLKFVPKTEVCRDYWTLQHP